MKKFSELRVGDLFHSTCSISEDELESYLNFSRIRNAFLEDVNQKGKKKRLVPGRAILARMEGEFTRLSQIYGNHILLIGTDSDPEWGNRSSRFLRQFHTDDVLNIKFVISEKNDDPTDDEFGRISIDYYGTTQDSQQIVVAKRNVYRIKKVPPLR